jgi:large subunit ribosomal protein L30
MRGAEQLAVIQVPDLTVKQVRSANGASPRQRATLRSLKLGRIGRSTSHTDSPQLQGMLRVVGHLVEVDGR